MTLEEFFVSYPRVAVAFSGGVDSAFLLYSALKCTENVKAYYVKSAFQPAFEYDDAVRLAKELGADMETIELDVLSDPDVASNPPNRCYYCKKKIFSSISDHALQDGFSVLLDGTNASDDADDRPGMKALSELSVLSPLRMCGLTKDEIRRQSKEAGLFTWNKPAYACLATRIPSGTKIDVEMLKKTEEAEGYLFSLGFTDFRIRSVGDMAKLQLPESQLPLLLKYRKNILDKLKSYYSSVCLDLEVRGEN